MAFPMMTVVERFKSLISHWTRVAGLLRVAAMACLTASLCLETSMVAAQNPPVHWLNAGAMPPGAIGGLRRARGGPLSGYFQPVEIRAPEGARISLAEEAGFTTSDSNRVLVGMEIGPVYRLRVSDLASDPGMEVFPTVEVIDRLYPPAGLATRYPIPVELTAEEISLAARGALVTRVIYLEEPTDATPGPHFRGEQPWVEAPQGADPLVVADEMGRPVAILRIGSRVPTSTGPTFGECAPQLVRYE